MLEIASGGSYCIPMIPQLMLRDLYSWHSQLLRRVVRSSWALENTIPSFNKDIPDDAVSIATAATFLFQTLAKASDNTEHTRPLLAANDRLHAVRLKEGRVLANLVSELRAVTTSTIAGSASDRLAVILASHRRRIRRVEKIAEAIMN